MSPRGRVMVTGSSGTVGTALCKRLLGLGRQVVGADCRPNPWNARLNELTVILDLCERESLQQLPTDIDMVIHLAAHARVYELVRQPARARDNLDMLFNVLEWCRRSGIARFVFASSREVYGNAGDGFHSEDESYVRCCESPYTASKVGGEAFVHAYHQCYGLEYVIVRLSNVYGRYDESTRVVPRFIRFVAQDRDLPVYGEDKYLDFTYIDDAIAGILACVEQFDQVKNDTFNIASGTGTSLIEVARLIQMHMGGRNGIAVHPTRPGEITSFVADISKARDLLRYRPQIDISEGLARSVHWYRTQGPLSRLCHGSPPT